MLHSEPNLCVNLRGHWIHRFQLKFCVYMCTLKIVNLNHLAPLELNISVPIWLKSYVRLYLYQNNQMSSTFDLVLFEAMQYESTWIESNRLASHHFHIKYWKVKESNGFFVNLKVKVTCQKRGSEVYNASDSYIYLNCSIWQVVQINVQYSKKLNK